MRRILGMMIGRTAATTIFLSLLAGVVIVAGCQTTASSAKPLSADMMTAWKNAGAEIGWVDPQVGFELGWAPTTPAEAGQIPAIEFKHWTPGMIAKLPRPDQPFALRIGGDLLDDYRNSQFDDTSMTELAGLTQLRVLQVGYTAVTDIGVSAVSGLTQLETLDLRHTQITDSVIIELLGFKQLHSLDLDGTQITGAGLSALTALPHLQTLDISSSPLTDAGLKEVAGLKQVLELHVRNANVTDEDLKVLAGLTQLQLLDLDGNADISNDGIMALANLKQLKRLNLRDTQVDDPGADALGDKIPDLDVED